MQNKKISQSLGHKLRIANNTIDRYFHSSWEKAGIEPTRMQCATLHYLKHHAKEDVFQKDLDGVKNINVFNRKSTSFDKAIPFIDKLNRETNCNVTLYDLADETMLRKALQESDILTNGTPVGMAPNTDATILTDTSMFHEDLIVSDVIYNPEETLLMKQAKAAGCRTFNGLYMLLYQGAEAFKIWTGKEMPVEIIKKKYFDR